MTPQYLPTPVNSRFIDPLVYLEFRYSKRAILFGLGDITVLPERKILRIFDVFVSRMHLDHLHGFDRMLRILLGRPRRVRLFVPEGLVGAIGHKLAACTWNFAPRVPGNLTFVVTETGGAPDDRPVHAAWETDAGPDEREIPLGLLKRDCPAFEPGRKVAYVTDAIHTDENRHRIVELAQGADTLFIEAAFATEDAARAMDRGHLTAGDLGGLARRAGVRRAEALHISSRYIDRELDILAQFADAFSGRVDISNTA